MSERRGRKSHSSASPEDKRGAGQTLREFRLRQQMTQQALASLVNESESTVGRWEGGHAPSNIQLERVVEKLGIDEATQRALYRRYGYELPPRLGDPVAAAERGGEGASGRFVEEPSSPAAHGHWRWLAFGGAVLSAAVLIAAVLAGWPRDEDQPPVASNQVAEPPAVSTVDSSEFP